MAKLAKKTITEKSSKIKTVRSPDWKEIYIDGVNITTDEHVTRIICLNHYLNITGSNSEPVNTEKVIKADIIVPNSALNEIVTVLSEVVKDIEKKPSVKKASVEVRDIKEQEK
ncbi:MAG: hypothetical protein PHH85_02835 [Candidatus Methanoperedens sp.]|nr:hypothetical protein [Candidatus Methanoperedens sp.]